MVPSLFLIPVEEIEDKEHEGVFHTLQEYPLTVLRVLFPGFFAKAVHFITSKILLKDHNDLSVL
jgi:hypothetical protein